MTDTPIRSDYEAHLEKILVGMAKLLQAHNERFGKIHASLLILRKAIASLHGDPEAAEEHLRQLVADAEKIVLEGSGFPEASALNHLLGVRKDPDKLDS